MAHDDGYKTDSFPFTPKKGSRTTRKYSPRPEVYAPPKAGQGEVCEGLNESRGQPFPSCKDGLQCIDSGAITIPGAGNVCATQREVAAREAEHEARAQAAEAAAYKRAEEAARKKA